VQWSHIRKYFYVYSYASGLLISKGLQHKVRENKEFINNVIEFLSSGSVESPETVFKKLGIDITSKQFWQSGLDDMRKTLDEAEELWGRVGNQ
jgi:oligoendopeptidase F